MEIGSLLYSACKSLALGYLLRIFLTGIDKKQYGSLVWMIAIMNVALCGFLIVLACINGISGWLEPFRDFVVNINESKLNPGNWWDWLPDFLKVKGE